jgi:hypothetical protein
MLLSVMLLLREQPEAAVASYAVAFLIKPHATSLAPVIGLVFLMGYTPAQWLKAGAAGIVTALVLLIPFFGVTGLPRLAGVLTESVALFPHTSLFAYNLWGIYGFWKDDTVPFVAGLTLRSFGMVLYIAGIICGSVALARHLRRNVHDAITIYFFATYFTFLPVMVLTRMHERYLYPVLPFLLVFAFLYAIKFMREGEREKLKAYLTTPPFLFYAALTLLHTFNLYHVYTYYLHFKTGVDKSNTFFYFVADHAVLWSVLVLALFFAMSFAGLVWLKQKDTPVLVQAQSKNPSVGKK